MSETEFQKNEKRRSNQKSSTVSFDKYTKPIIEPFKKQTHFCVGFTGSSKSTTVEVIAEKLLDAGQTGFDAYGGEWHESAFWSITMGCEFDKEYPCNCKGYETDVGRYPMTLLIPYNFILTDKNENPVENICKICNKEEKECSESEEKDHEFIPKPTPLDFYNDNRFSLWEYKRYLNHKGITGLIEYNHNNPPQRPQGSPKVPWIRLVRLPKAKNNTGFKEMFDFEENIEIRNIFCQELKFARDEGHKRIVVFNVGFWGKEFQRMKTLEILIRSLERAKEKVFTPLMIFDRPRSQWTSREKTFDKLFMLFRELGEVTNQNIKTDAGGWSTFLKKALGWYIRKGRQLGCSLIADMQRPEDVMPGIRTHADWFHIKNTPLSLLGESWNWLTNKNMTGYLDKKRQEILESTNWNYNKANERYPQIQDLTKAYGYAVSKEDVVKLLNYTMPKHHHWDPDHGDHWPLITGIYFKTKSTTSKTEEEKEEVSVVDNTVEQVGIIQSMLKDKKMRDVAIKEYGLESKGRWTWENFVYPIYKTWIDKNVITTIKVRPNGDALKTFYNKHIRKKSLA